jgi:hypothetical protein
VRGRWLSAFYIVIAVASQNQVKQLSSKKRYAPWRVLIDDYESSTVKLQQSNAYATYAYVTVGACRENYINARFLLLMKTLKKDGTCQRRTNILVNAEMPADVRQEARLCLFSLLDRPRSAQTLV